MKTIVAIGGGEIGRPGFPIETTDIDKEIIRLTNKKSPILLFIPTASGDSDGYTETVKKYFGQKLGCKIDVLRLTKGGLSKEQIRKQVLSADIVYVGGGNTFRMMKLWRKLGVDKILQIAYEQGVIVSGLSAGAICWFKYGNSDSRKIKNPSASLIKVSGLNLIPALLCPHYDFEKDRKPDLKKMMRKTAGVAIALDNCCAIEIVDKQYRIIASKDSANAYKVFWLKGKYHEVMIPKITGFSALAGLLKK